MKTTKKLIKTMLMSLMLVSCLGANAMAEEDGMDVILDISSNFTWEIPSELTIDQNDLKNKSLYETNFDISITSVTLRNNEEVQVMISKESKERYDEDEKEFYLTDTNIYNNNFITFYIRETEGIENIGTNELLLSADLTDFSGTTSPVSKTLKLVMPCNSTLNHTGNYRANIIFQAGVVTKSA